MGEVMREVKNLPLKDQQRVMKSVDNYLKSNNFEGLILKDWMEMQYNKGAKSTTKTNVLGTKLFEEANRGKE